MHRYRSERALLLFKTCQRKNRVSTTQRHTSMASIQKDFEDSDYLFSSIVWETTGAVNTEGEELLRLIMRFASKRLGREHSSFCGRQWARLSCYLPCLYVFA